MDTERRYSQRRKADNISISLRPLDPQVWFRFWSGTEYTIRDISMVGVGLCSKERMPEGTPISLDIRLDKNEHSIRIFGKVEWVCEDVGTYRTGISFSWWKDDQDKKTAGTYLEKLANIN